MKTTSAITGIHTRYDVKTKCLVVQSILTNNTFKTKKSLNDYIEATAKALLVNPVTIKVWIQKYQHTYNQGSQLPDGVMSHSFLTIDENTLPKVKTELNKLKAQLTKIREQHETTSLNIKTSTLRTFKKPKAILEELINETTN